MGGPAAGEAEFGIPVEATFTGPVVVAPLSNRGAWTSRTAVVAVPGTPVQGPDVAIPDGFSVLVEFRITQPDSPIGYVANSGANTALSANRKELVKGGAFTLYVTNMNLIFFDSDTAGAVFELTVEQ